MKQRCYNKKRPDYPRYGGRGIAVCDKWKGSFKAFLKDMGNKPKRMTLERVGNSGNYEPSNCEWVTMKRQYKRWNSKNKGENII